MTVNNIITPLSGMKRVLDRGIALFSTLLVGGFFYYIYTLFQQYDWGHPFTKLMCFAAVFLLLIFLYQKKKNDIDTGNAIAKLELLLALGALVWIIVIMSPKYLTQLSQGPGVDIGYTTQNSAIVLFREHKNPYMSETINIRPELEPKYRGFHYGPGMLIGYVASAYVPNIGYKITNLVFLVGTIVALLLLIDGSRRQGVNYWQRASAMAIVLSLFLLPERLWYELFQQGANDIFPIMLLLLGLVFVQRGYWVWAGIFMGFSFATKFSPAAFLLVLFLRKDIKLNFLIGCCIGASPLMVFMLWDYQSLINNVFILRFTLGYDATSLYSITPAALHYLFPLSQVVALVILMKVNVTRQLEIDRLILHFTLLLIVIGVTFKEVHANHLIWFYPLFAYLATRYRYQLIPRFGKAS